MSLTGRLVWFAPVCLGQNDQSRHPICAPARRDQQADVSRRDQAGCVGGLERRGERGREIFTTLVGQQDEPIERQAQHRASSTTKDRERCGGKTRAHGVDRQALQAQGLGDRRLDPLDQVPFVGRTLHIVQRGRADRGRPCARSRRHHARGTTGRRSGQSPRDEGWGKPAQATVWKEESGWLTFPPTCSPGLERPRSHRPGGATLRPHVGVTWGHFRSCTLLSAKADVLLSLNRSILGRCPKIIRTLAETRSKTVHLLRSVLIFLWPFVGRSTVLKRY